MAKLIAQGGFAAPESDVPVPADGLSRAAVRELIGVPVVVFPAPLGGFLFVRDTREVHRAGLKPNMRASALCGHLVYGPALHVRPADRVNWHDPEPAPGK